MFPRKPLENWQESAQRNCAAAFWFAPRLPLCHRLRKAGASLSPARFDQVTIPFQTNLPGPCWVGRFFVAAGADGQRPADAGDLPFRAAAHRIKLRTSIPQTRGRFPCVSPFLSLPLRPLPLVVAGRPTSSARSSAPPPARSLQMPRAAMRWPVRRLAVLPERSATISTSASKPVRPRDSILSIRPRLLRQAWFFLLRQGVAGNRPCSKRS